MASTLVISNMATGFETDREPFLINNDAFPVLNNAYQWRGKIKRKRGSSFLGRLRWTTTIAGGASAPLALGNTSGGGGLSVNLFTLLNVGALQPNAQIIINSLSVVVGADTFTESSPGLLTGSTIGTGTINYQNGALTLTGAPAATPATAVFSYHPNLPVMGLEDFETEITNFPTLVAFDTNYSYQFNASTNVFYNTNFYKTSGVPFHFNGAAYQQFWTCNYLGAMWTTNGVPGMQFKALSNVVQITPTTATLNIIAHGLALNDYVFVNEVGGASATTINGQSGQVTAVTDPNNVVVTFPNATLGAAYTAATGIAQYLTRSVFATQDGIRWYDGDPIANATNGWVNFAPPIDNKATAGVTLYLVGAKMILPFKNRLMFFGVYLQTSTGSAYYVPNEVVWSEVGSPYYSLPLPTQYTNQGVTAPIPQAWFTNVVGFGGFLVAPYDQNIVTVGANEDVILVGLETRQTKMIFTFNDAAPFIFQTINSELGSANTFSGISLDNGLITIGEYGIAITNQNSSKRIDVKIPDFVFDISSVNNTDGQVTAGRDYRNEFIYFTFIDGLTTLTPFPNKTLLYNYRENTWATFDECYTSYGTYRPTTSSGRTWANIGLLYPTWEDWTDPWNFGADVTGYPNVVGGNQNGFVLIKGEGIREDASLYVQNMAYNAPTNSTLITCPNHCLNDGDYVVLSGIIGGASMQALNGVVEQVTLTTSSSTFLIETPVSSLDTYIGGGLIRRLSVPFIQTKQFPAFWEGGRGSRIGAQKYLLQTTSPPINPSYPPNQITVYVYVDQNPEQPSNDTFADPYLPFSTVVLTCPEGNNLFGIGQNQIWHRMNNSFVGDSVQLAFTLNDTQMRDNLINSSEIEIHAIVIDLYPGPILGRALL